MAEGHCPCKDQVARTCLAGRESCAAFPGLSGAGLQALACRLGKASHGRACAWGSASQESVTRTNTGLSPGLGGSVSDSMEKVQEVRS